MSKRGRKEERSHTSNVIAMVMSVSANALGIDQSYDTKVSTLWRLEQKPDTYIKSCPRNRESLDDKRLRLR